MGGQTHDKVEVSTLDASVLACPHSPTSHSCRVLLPPLPLAG